MSDQHLLQKVLEKAATTQGHITALSQIEGISYSYSELFQAVKAMSRHLHNLGIAPNDRIAILGDNSPHWPLAYFAINRAGAVAVPILPDFSTDDISVILKESGSKAVFVSASIAWKAEACRKDHSQLTYLSLADFSIIEAEFPTSENLLKIIPQDNEDYYLPKEETALASLIFTSGTTGKSKGVMLSEKNLVWDAANSLKITHVNPGETFLSILPLSHTYEFTIGLLVPFLATATICYLNGPPIPRFLLPALQKARPHFMLSVPLIIEKIYRLSIKPRFNKNNLIGKLYKRPFFRKVLNKLAGKKLLKTFGNRLRFFGIGGAPVSAEVEYFLREASFPYAIGYGLTETSPLIAGSDAFKTTFRAIGPVIQGLEVKIDAPQEGYDHGEILVKGPNVMLGYYNNPEETEKVLTRDGWFHTGDLGDFDQQGNLYIKGRSKNLILGPSGENIYPEAIEELLNAAAFVEESLVVHEPEKGLVALVQVNYDRLKEYLQSVKEDIADKQEQVQALLKNLKSDVNRKLAAFSRLSIVIEQVDPFVKTPTKKIKRYLYGNSAKI